VGSNHCGPPYLDALGGLAMSTLPRKQALIDNFALFCDVRFATESGHFGAQSECPQSQKGTSSN
jgi:hypothetical protein